MNSVVRSSFKVVFAEKSTYGSREQRTGPTQNAQSAQTQTQTLYPNMHLNLNLPLHEIIRVIVGLLILRSITNNLIT